MSDSSSTLNTPNITMKELLEEKVTDILKQNYIGKECALAFGTVVFHKKPTHRVIDVKIDFFTDYTYFNDTMLCFDSYTIKFLLETSKGRSKRWVKYLL